MGDFVEGIKSASQKSVDSAVETIDAPDIMSEKIGNVWAFRNDENQRHVSKVSESISSIAAVSREISSSMRPRWKISSETVLSFMRVSAMS